MVATFNATRTTGVRRRPPRNGASREELLRRRVLPLAEFAAEVARGSGQAAKPPAAERLRLYGSTIIPIAVPLAPGESEAMYEAKFEQWLAARHISLKELVALPDPNRERTTRCSYAVNLARAFLATQVGTSQVAVPATVSERTRDQEEKELEEGEEVEDDENKVQQEPLDLSLLPRKVLNATKVTSLAEYQADAKAGKFALLGFMSAAEKQRLFGAPVVPIAVPLAPRETVQQYEERFLTWLVREKRMTLGALQSHKVAMLERYMRLEFASLNGNGLQRFVAPRKPPRKRTVAPATTGCSPLKKAKTEKMQETKKAMPPEQHAHAPSTWQAGELSVVMSAARECEKEEKEAVKEPQPPAQEAEARSLVGLDLSSVLTAKENTKAELTECSKVEDQDVKEEKGEPTELGTLPLKVLNASKITTLAEYRADVQVGKFTSLGSMTSSEMQRRFGAPVAPIVVPLAPGETPELFEDRFLNWLVRKKQMTLGAVRSHKVRMLERLIRIEFARLNAKGVERFTPPLTPPLKRTATIEMARRSPSKKIASENTGDTKIDEQPGQKSKAPAACDSGQSSVAACVACQCKQCLVSGIRLLSERITACETMSSCDDQREVMDLTHERSPSKEYDRPEIARQGSTAKQLQQAYDEINDGILLNEEALKIEESRLTTQYAGIAIDELVRLQRENEEMRELIEGEFTGRTAAAAVLIAYLWRQEATLLTEMLDEPTVCDLPHVQQRIHERMSELVNAHAANSQAVLTKPRADGDKQEEQGMRVPDLDRLRRQQLALLVHFDCSVRRAVQSVLTAAGGPVVKCTRDFVHNW